MSCGTTALVEAPRTDSLLEQLDALRALLNHLEGLQDKTSAGVQYAVITLLEDTWHYSFQYYFSIKRAGEADVETDTSSSWMRFAHSSITSRDYKTKHRRECNTR